MFSLVAAGTSDTVVLPAGYFMSFSLGSDAMLVFRPPGTAQQTQRAMSGTRIGPFAADVDVAITAAADTEFSIYDPTTQQLRTASAAGLGRGAQISTAAGLRVGQASSAGLALSDMKSSVASVDLPNNALATSQPLLAGRCMVPGGSLGPNGAIEVDLEVLNYSGAAATLNVTVGRHQAWAVQTSVPTRLSTRISNMNTTKAQRTIRASDGQVLITECDTDQDFLVELWVQKTNASDVVRVVRFDVRVVPNMERVEEARYLTTSGVFTVTQNDYKLRTLPTRVTADPALSVRALTAAPFTFPSDFWGIADLYWPFLSSVRSPLTTYLHRTHDREGLSWFGMQTAQASAAYSNPTGPAPAGISAANLAILDNLFAQANALGLKLIVNLLGDSAAAPAWMTALGFQNNRIQIPAAGANRTAGLNSLGFYVRFLCERYTALYPALTWYIEPINEPNLTWNGVVADLVALIAPIVSNVSAHGAGRVRMVCSSWTDRSQVTFQNPGSPALGSNTPTLHEYIANGGWAQFEILSYHLYNGTIYNDNITTGNPIRIPTFRFDNKILDPLSNATSNGRFIGLRQTLIDAGVGGTVVPGAQLGGGKEFWMTECGDALMGSRDRDWFIWNSLVMAALGTRHAVFYFNGNNQFGALPSMELFNARKAWEEAQAFLGGKTISWINASNDLMKGAALVGGVEFTYGI